MKNTKRVLFAVVAVMLLLASVITGVFAIKAGDGTTPEEYETMEKIFSMDFEDTTASAKQIGDCATKTVGIGNITYLPLDTDPNSTSILYNNDGKKLVPYAKLMTNNLGAPYIYGTGSSSQTYLQYDTTVCTDGNIPYPIINVDKDFNKPDTYSSGDGYAIEFDMMVDPTNPSAKNPSSFTIELLNSNWAGGYGSMFLINYGPATGGGMQISVHNNHSACAVNGGKVVIASGWAHVSFLYDGTRKVLDVFVGKDSDANGRVQIANDIPCYDDGRDATSTKFPDYAIYPQTIRFNMTQKGNKLAIDNLLAYQAKTIHDPDFIETVTTERDRFIFYVNSLNNETIASANRKTIADKIRNEMLATYWNGSSYVGGAANDTQLKAAVDSYNSFMNSSYQQIIEEAKAENTATFVSYVNDLYGLERSFASVSTRQNKILIVDDFLASTAGVINRGDQTYLDAADKFSKVKEWVLKDQNASDFVFAMERFKLAQEMDSAIAMKRRYTAAEKIYSSLPAANELITADKNALNTALQTYANALDILENAEKDSTSERLIKIINLIKDTTEADWIADEENGGEIESYWSTARKVINDTEIYNISYAGLSDALTAFAPIDEYFWEKLQNEHIATVTAKLNLFENASYIDKAGICTYVERYFINNAADVDDTNLQINSLKVRLVNYKAQLTNYEKDYKLLLEQNTTLFLNKMTEISVTTGYASILPLFEEATEYYYCMNIQGDAVIAAVAAYEALREELTLIELDSALFVETMESYRSGLSKAQRYAILAEAFNYTAHLDETFEGADDAIDAYDEGIVEFNSQANAVNEEVDETADIMCAVRSFCSSASLINYVRSLFN